MFFEFVKASEKRTFVTALRGILFGEEWGKCKDRWFQGFCLGVHDKVPRLHANKVGQKLAATRLPAGRLAVFVPCSVQAPAPEPCTQQTLNNPCRTREKGASPVSELSSVPLLYLKIYHYKFIPLDLNKKSPSQVH